MADTGQAWSEVGRNFEALGLKLKMHLEQGVDEENRDSLETAVKNLGKLIEQGVHAIGSAVRDPAVQTDFDRVAASIRDALAASVDQAGDTIRGGSRKD